MYSRSPWELGMDDAEVKIYNNSTKKISKKISVSDINEIDLRVAKGFNNAPGIFMTQTLCLKIDMKIEEENYQFICEDLGAIPLVFKWMQRNNINYTDFYNLENLYDENNEKEAIDILYSKIEEIQGR